MSWVGIAVGVGGAVVGAVSANQTGKKQIQAGKEMNAEEWAHQKEMYERQLQDSRVNQSTDFGSLTWSQDPETGKWSQKSELNPAEAARLGDYRQIAADRMASAKGISSQFAQGGINYDALGMGKIASAAGVQGGGNSDAIGDARNGVGVIGQPSISRFQGPSAGGGGMGRPPMGPPPMGRPQGGPPQGNPAGPGAAGGQQRVPYTPAPITPEPAAPVAPPPATPPPAAPPPSAAPPGMDLNQFLSSGLRGVDDEMYNHIGGDAMLEQARKIDPNARWRTGDIGSGGDDPHPQQGRMLDINPAMLAALRNQGQP